MSLKRTDLIFHRIESNIRAEGKSVPDPAVVLDRMDQIQQELCEKSLAFKFETKLVLQKDKEMYDLGLKIYKPKSIIPPITWHGFPTWCWIADKWQLEYVTSTERWSELQRSRINAPHPIAVMNWNQHLRFYPIPQVTGEELYMFLYLVPSKKLDFDTDPELLTEWDTALELGTTAKLIGGDWEKRYMMERADKEHASMIEITEGERRVRHWSDVGF